MSRDYLSALAGQRFALVDAVRGVAACAVVARHLFYNGSLGERLEAILPLPVQLLSIWGAAGVYAFFVISGFVIAHSLRDNPLDGAGIGRFALRRQIRLDLPYWAAIGLGLVASLPDFDIVRELGVRGILLNALYLQYFTGTSSVVWVAWTLCIEVQFYLAFVALLWLCRNRRARASFNASRAATAAVLVTGIAAMVLAHRLFLGQMFPFYWHYFALGVVIYWALRGALPAWAAWLYVGAFALSTVFSNWHGINDYGALHSLSFTSMLIGLLTALLFWWAGTRNRLTIWGQNPALQYLGRISYSLYLIHPVVILQAHRVNFHLPHTVALALVYWFLTPLVCLACAHLFYRWVERPSVALAARLRGASDAALISSAP